LPLAEERADERRHEARIAEVGDARVLGLPPEVVAVIEEDGAGPLELEHRAHLRGNRLVRALAIRLGIPDAQGPGLLHRELGRDIAGDHVVSGGLIGHDVDARAAAGELGMHRGGVPVDGDRERLASRPRFLGPAKGFVERRGRPVDVPQTEPSLDALAIDLDEEADAAVQGDGERLGAPHSPEAGGEHEPTGQRAAEVLAGTGAEGLVGSLQNALRADVGAQAPKVS